MANGACVVLVNMAPQPERRPSARDHGSRMGGAVLCAGEHGRRLAHCTWTGHGGAWTQNLPRTYTMGPPRRDLIDSL